LVAIIHPDTKQPIALKDIDNKVLVPSVLHFGAHDLQVGNEAIPYLESDTAHTIYSVKRLMGKSYNDVKNNDTSYAYTIINDDTDKLVKIKIGDKFYSPIELSSYILIELKKRAEHALKMNVSKCQLILTMHNVKLLEMQENLQAWMYCAL
jgi:molecular chaperone HscA